MRPEELIRLLTSKEAAEELAGAIADPGLQAGRGWDLHAWKCNPRPGAFFFVCHDTQGQASSLVVALTTPENPPDELTAALAQRLLPITVVIVK